jgi:CBS domain-containing protein
MRSSLKAVLEKKGRQIISVDPTITVLQAAETMIDNHVGAVLVLVDDKLVGIFTERDILTRIVSEGRDPAKTRVAEVMTSSLAVVGADTTVDQAMAIFTEKRCRHLPVMDGNEILGLVSSGDLTRWVTSKKSDEVEELIRYIRGEYTA